jgi:hypothetical protein
VKIKKTIGRLGPDVPGDVTRLHDGGHDAEDDNILKEQVAELKRVVFTYKSYEGVMEALFCSSSHS